MAVFSSILCPRSSPVADKENLTSSPAHAKAPAVVAAQHSLTGRTKRTRHPAPPPTPGASYMAAARRQPRPSPFRLTTSGARVDEDAHMSQGLPVGRVRMRFPLHLARPAFRDIDEKVLAALDPEFPSVPLGYVHDKLKAVGEQLLAAVASASAAPCTGLPAEVEVLVDEGALQVPTHMLAVFQKDTPEDGQRRKVQLFPMHDVVLAAHCANLPALPRSSPSTPAPGTPTKLPVVKLCLPNIPTFPILQHYLYTKRIDILLASLFPRTDETIPAANPGVFLASACTPAVLSSHLFLIHGLWANACVLGVYDDALWRVMDMSWSILMEALSRAKPSDAAVDEQ